MTVPVPHPGWSAPVADDAQLRDLADAVARELVSEFYDADGWVTKHGVEQHIAKLALGAMKRAVEEMR